MIPPSSTDKMGAPEDGSVRKFEWFDMIICR